LVQGTVPSGGRSPGMKTFVSHQAQVTMRKGLSLMIPIQFSITRKSDNDFSR